VRELFRVVHALKGMAASMGDDVTAWYCHGVELALKLALDSGQFERRLLDELLRHADLVRGLVEDGEATLDALRASTGGTRSGSRSSRLRPSAEPVMGAPLSSHAPPQSKRRPSLLTLEDAEEPGGARFAPALVDALLDQMTRIEGVVGQLENAVVALNAQAHGAQEARGALLQEAVEVAALSAWHEPTQTQWALSATTERLHALADASRTTAEQLRRQVEVLRQSARETRTRLRRLGSTTVGWLFERLEHAVEQTASRDGRLVRTDCVGEEISLPRTVAEQLLDPLQQAVRNALAHGVEPPEVRAAAGKDPVATITLRASESGDWLRIEVADDGPGVDLTKLRQLVVARGLMSTEHMLSASDQELLGQLFAPGFTTRSDSSMLAGRGVGLDLVQSSLRRLDAVARITSEMGHGFTLIFDVPLQRHAVEVLWVQAGPFELALPTVCVGRVLSQPVPNATHLGGCVGLDATGTARHQLELAIPGVVPIPVGVDGLGAVESVMVRSLPETLRRAGPFAGAVSRGDGSLRVVLDPALAGAALWAVASRRTSLTP